jgi:hypothetical protein
MDSDRKRLLARSIIWTLLTGYVWVALFWRGEYYPSYELWRLAQLVLVLILGLHAWSFQRLIRSALKNVSVEAATLVAIAESVIFLLVSSHIYHALHPYE